VFLLDKYDEGRIRICVALKNSTKQCKAVYQENRLCVLRSELLVRRYGTGLARSHTERYYTGSFLTTWWGR